MAKIDVASSANPEVLRLLRSHPRVAAVTEGNHGGVDFYQGNWRRRVTVGEIATDPYGLVELMDNNPMVCADVVSTPGAATTLALIALGPLAQAGLIVERPTMAVSSGADEEEIQGALGAVGWHEGITLHAEDSESAVVAATVISAIQTPEDLDDLDALYAEAYGRSFFVLREEGQEWSPTLVQGKPHAAYRLRVSPDDPYSLLTVQVIADRNGKCGAAQVIHAMNVMAGFEESLGL